MISDKFTKRIAQEIADKLKFYSPRDRRMPFIEHHLGQDTKGYSNRKNWAESRPKPAKHLADSWKIKSRKGISAGRSIYNLLPYAQFLAYGTGIYGPRGMPITPKVKKSLHFYYSFFRKWVVAKQVKGINPARFQKVIDLAQYRGTVIGARRAMTEVEDRWRGTLQIKLIKL